MHSPFNIIKQNSIPQQKYRCIYTYLNASKVINDSMFKFLRKSMHESLIVIIQPMKVSLNQNYQKTNKFDKKSLWLKMFSLDNSYWNGEVMLPTKKIKFAGRWGNKLKWREDFPRNTSLTASECRKIKRFSCFLKFSFFFIRTSKFRLRLAVIKVSPFLRLRSSYFFFLLIVHVNTSQTHF